MIGKETKVTPISQDREIFGHTYGFAMFIHNYRLIT
jgi:hypothetical protein